MKQRINSEFITAFKAKDMFRKDVLGMLKTRITEAEKKDGKELTDDQVMNVINSSLKQVEQTISMTQSNPESSVYTEALKEKEILMSFMPTQLTDAEIESEVIAILEDMIFPPEQSKQAMGAVMRYFKEKFNGQYNAATLKSIVDRFLA